MTAAVGRLAWVSPVPRRPRLGQLPDIRVLERWYRPVAFGLAAALGVVAAVVAVLRFQAFIERGLLGGDYDILTEYGRRWLATGSMYLPSQLAGPFAAQPDATNPDLALSLIPSLYPPTAALLFASLTVLPSFLWWAVPLGLIAFAIARWRPAPWTWPILVGIACLPAAPAVVAGGGSTMWIVAAVAAGLMWGWPVLLVALKPTFAPFLLLGVKRRSWWLGAALLGVVSLLMVSEWVRYLAVLRNVTGAGLLYSINDLPLVLAPVVAWLGRRSSTR